MIVLNQNIIIFVQKLMSAKVIPNHVMENALLENDIALNMEWSFLNHGYFF